MNPVKEQGSLKYLKSKDYYPYVGMGLVQLTWDYNYIKAGKFLGVDFMKLPEKLLLPEYAVPILVKGMKDGWFTGKKLSDYITLKTSNFFEARRIVNRLDDAQLIASYAWVYDNLLKKEGYGVTA